jgi:hypothetical protein
MYTRTMTPRSRVLKGGLLEKLPALCLFVTLENARAAERSTNPLSRFGILSRASLTAMGRASSNKTLGLSVR